MNDNLYNIDDRNHEEEDTRSEALYTLEDTTASRGPNRHEYVLIEEAEEDAESWRGESPVSRASVFGLLFKIMTTPVEGWKALKRCRLKAEEVAATGFYPLLALAAVSEFTALFYEAHVTISALVIPAIVTFITFFFGYFSVLLCGAVFLPAAASEKLKTQFGRQYIMMNVSTLALFYIMHRIIPILDPVVAFLPLWTIYLAWKGVKYLRVPPELETRTGATLSVLILACPLFWNWIFGEFLPSGL